MRQLAEGQILHVEPIEIDRYNRIVARVYLDNGIDLSQVMVAGGYARAATTFTQAYADDQHQARRAGRGLWAQPGGGIADPAGWRRATR